MAGRRPTRPNTHGAHYLQSWAVGRVLDAVPTEPDEIVVDLGAGIGALTVPLARRGARVVAVEQHDASTSALRRRVASLGVTVMQGDIRNFRWPTRPFRIVANPPFGLSIWLLRELAQRAPPWLREAHLLLQRGLVRQLTQPPRDVRTAKWQHGANFHEVLQLPPAAFAPPPRVGASLLHLIPRPNRRRRRPL